jgi:L-threonylcarbamoyladenylate synthase
MRTIRINRSRVSRRALAEALSVLRRGGVVVYPTETAYGLAADPTDTSAARHVFLIKGRSGKKSLPLIFSSARQVENFAVLKGKIGSLARRQWPGALTVVIKPRTKFAPGVAAKDGTVAARVPGLAWPRALAAALGRPITSTSANLSGQPATYRASEIIRVFRGRKYQPDLFLDAGDLPPRPASTIVRLRRGRIEVLRQGHIRIN